jgi:hypothetical protein
MRMTSAKQTPSATHKNKAQRQGRVVGRLDAKRPKDHVVVHYGNGADGDVFSVEKVLAAMRGDQAMNVTLGVLKKRYEALDDQVQTWIVGNMTKLARCWMTCRDGALLLLVVSATADYDEALHDSLIDLSVKTNQTMGEFPLRLRTMLLPGPDGEPERSFMDSSLQHRLYPTG